MKNAFTLSEILITLGIIGVVAALTIPTLMTNINSRKISSQFKKTISTLNQAARMAEAQYDMNFSSAEYCYMDSNEPIENGGRSVCSIFKSTLKGYQYEGTTSGSGYTHEYFGQKYKFGDMATSVIDDNGSDYNLFQLADGAYLFISPGAGHCFLTDNKMTYSDYSDLSSHGCIGFIDVNGSTRPNKEVKCSTGTTSTDLNEPCTVNAKDMGDIFPIAFYDGTVVPMTNAGKYVLNTAK